ncbi:MAG: histidine kinase [Ferruginibacter sp.]
MMQLIKIISLTIFISLPVISYSQVAKKDSAIVFSLIDKAEAFFTDANYDSALFYCDKAEAYSRLNNYKKGIAYSLIEKTDIYIDKDDLDKASELPSKTNILGQQTHDSLIMAISVMQMAQIKMYGGKYDEAVALFEKCTKNYFSRHPSKYAALAYNDFGYTYGMKGDLASKATHIIKAISIYETLNLDNYGERAAALNNLATVYYELNQRQKAIEYAVKSIAYREKSGDIARLSLGCCNLSQMYVGVDDAESVKYQKLCVKYAEQSGDQSRIMHAYVTSSLIASHQKDIKKSLEYELKTITLLEKNKTDPQMLARRYISAGMGSATLKEDSATTVGYFNKALEQSERINNKINLRDVYNQLSLFYKNHNNISKAYDYYTKHIIYRDSVINSSIATNIADLEKKYQTEKKDNEISRLNTTQRIKELQIEKQNALLAGNMLEAEKKQNEIALLSKTQELQELEIARQDEELEKQKLLAKNNQQQLQLAEKEKLLQQRQIKNSEIVRNLILAAAGLLLLLGYFLFNRYQLKRKIEEQEALLVVRNNIAKDLHDEIGSTLTSIKILSEVSEKNVHKDQAKASAFLQKITEQSTAAQQGISDIVWALKPENDKLENMVIRMREYIAQTLESKNIQTRINIDEKLLANTLDTGQRRDFFLIFKEAVNNIAKYAGASVVQVNLEKKNTDLLMQINDNGKGFDTNKQTSSSGLKNMKSRAEALHGILQIASAAEKGTTVTLIIPAT